MHILVRLVIIRGLSITFYDNLIKYYKLHLKTPLGISNEVYFNSCLINDDVEHWFAWCCCQNQRRSRMHNLDQQR